MPAEDPQLGAQELYRERAFKGGYYREGGELLEYSLIGTKSV